MAVGEFLVVEDVSYAWRSGDYERRVFDGLSFALNRGEILAVTGPSGCGKTTLVRVIAGLLQPMSGRIIWAPPGNGGPRIGFMFQDFKLFPWLTVSENLAFGSKERQGSEKAQTIVKLLGLQDHLAEYPSRLSGGLKERTSLGRALLSGPDLLILDEPLESTDYLHRLQIEDFIFDYVVSAQSSAIVVTHDLDQAIALSHRVLILPAADSAKKPTIVPVPTDFRRHRPSQARLSRDFGPAVLTLISRYQELL